MALIQNIRARILFSAFTLLGISQYITYMRNVIIKLTGNVSFPLLTPTVPDMTASIDDVEAKAGAALDGSKLDRAVRNLVFANSKDLARQLATNVQLVSNGDIEMALSSGFSIAAGRGPVEPVNMPTNLRLSEGANSGELDVRFGRNGRNSLMFDVQHSATPDGVYTDHPSVSSTRTTLTGLTPGEMYWVRVRSNGAGGSSNWTGPSCRIVI